MTTQNNAAKSEVQIWSALASAGIAAPPLGSFDPADVVTYSSWSWGTRHLDEEDDLYMFRDGHIADSILQDGPFFALCHAGHGMNSYALSLVTRKGAVGAFVQHGWGGVYMDSLQSVFAINQTYARLHTLFDRITDPTAELRWIVEISRSRGVCGVVDLVEYQQTGSITEAYTAFKGEARVFEFFEGQPGLLTGGKSTDWGFPPAPFVNPALQGKTPPVSQLPKHERLEQVARAQAIAVVAHRGQADKSGVDYIHHSAAVAARFDPETETVECCAGWLHDVIEDTDISAARLDLAGIHPEIVETVQLLTRQEGQGDAYYAAIAANPKARRVKLADLDDNTDPRRLERLSDETRSALLEKYDHAYGLLGAHGPDELERLEFPLHQYGNPRLYLPAAQVDSDPASQPAGQADASRSGVGYKPPSAHTEYLAWLYASRYLPSRPSLILSWMDWHDGVPHFVLHRDPYSASIHFDADDRPLWVGPDGEQKRVVWDDVHEMGELEFANAFDLDSAWGPTADDVVTPRGQAYELMARFAAPGGDEERVSIRPAKLLAADGEPAAYDLVPRFPTLTLTLGWYSDLIAVEYRRRLREGKAAYWHEPLWLVRRDGLPIVVVDEAGRAHAGGRMFDIGLLLRSEGDAQAAADLLLHVAAAAEKPDLSDHPSISSEMQQPAVQSPPSATKNSILTSDGRLELAGWVEALGDGEVFVFGSNAAGHHDGGAARVAHKKFGAIWGQAHGLQGRSYAIDTMTDIQTMEADIDDFLEFAAEHPDRTFLVTEIGCGIGPYRPWQVAPMFAHASANVALPASFLAILRR